MNARTLAEDSAGDLRIDAKVAYHLADFAITVLDVLDNKNTPPSDRAAVRGILGAIEARLK